MGKNDGDYEYDDHDNPRINKSWFRKINWRAVLILSVIIIAFASFSIRTLLTAHESSHIQAEIVRVEVDQLAIKITNITWADWRTTSIESGDIIYINLGVCFDERYTSLCDIGTHVDIKGYRNYLFNWWYQEAIIHGHT